MRMTSQIFHSTDPTHPLMPSIARIRVTDTDEGGDDYETHYVLAYHAERDLPALMTAGQQRLTTHDIVMRLIHRDYTSELGNGLSAFSRELICRYNELRSHAKSNPNNQAKCETCKGKGRAYKVCEFTGDYIMADCDDCRAQRTK